ncbi:hypothetical protein GCM10023205_81750 [Yinghuangia aomiensis]|uniref:Uncharacterized protein n=1 Tax=Yinghuangia aomiensis TaxID=676205 RepID=A0ABP9IFL3_9ACTN
MPRELKVLDMASLVRPEERACELILNQRLDPAWVQANAAPDGTHHLWPALWNGLPDRPASRVRFGANRSSRCMRETA